MCEAEIRSTGIPWDLVRGEKCARVDLPDSVQIEWVNTAIQRNKIEKKEKKMSFCV